MAEEKDWRLIAERKKKMKEYTLDCMGEACPLPMMKTEKQMFLMKLIEEYANAVSDYECSSRERGIAFAKEEMKIMVDSK